MTQCTRNREDSHHSARFNSPFTFFLSLGSDLKEEELQRRALHLNLTRDQ